MTSSKSCECAGVGETVDPLLTPQENFSCIYKRRFFVWRKCLLKMWMYMSHELSKDITTSRLE